MDPSLYSPRTSTFTRPVAVPVRKSWLTSIAIIPPIIYCLLFSVILQRHPNHSSHSHAASRKFCLCFYGSELQIMCEKSSGIHDYTKWQPVILLAHASTSHLIHV